MSNSKNFFYQQARNLALTDNLVVYVRDEIGALVDELVLNTKKVIRATSREVNKWRGHGGY